MTMPNMPDMPELPELPDEIAGITMGAVFAQAQALDLAMRDAMSGDCKDCACSVCETLRGMAQRVGLTDG